MVYCQNNYCCEIVIRLTNYRLISDWYTASRMQQLTEQNCNLAAATSCYNCKRPRSLTRTHWKRLSLLGRGICIHIRRPNLDSDSFAVNRWNWESKSNRHLLNWISLVLPVKVWPINYYSYKLNLIKTSLRFHLKNQWKFYYKTLLFKLIHLHSNTPN